MGLEERLFRIVRVCVFYHVHVVCRIVCRVFFFFFYSFSNIHELRRRSDACVCVGARAHATLSADDDRVFLSVALLST